MRARYLHAIAATLAGQLVDNLPARVAQPTSASQPCRRPRQRRRRGSIQASDNARNPRLRRARYGRPRPPAPGTASTSCSISGASEWPSIWFTPTSGIPEACAKVAKLMGLGCQMKITRTAGQYSFQRQVQMRGRAGWWRSFRGATVSMRIRHRRDCGGGIDASTTIALTSDMAADSAFAQASGSGGDRYQQTQPCALAGETTACCAASAAWYRRRDKSRWMTGPSPGTARRRARRCGYGCSLAQAGNQGKAL